VLLQLLLLPIDWPVLFVLLFLCFLYLLLVVLTVTTDMSILHVNSLGADGPEINKSARCLDLSLVKGSKCTLLPIRVRCLASVLLMSSCLATL